MAGTSAGTGSRAHAASSEPTATLVDARPAAIVDGRTVSWGELRPLLNEAAGATVLQELILDRLVHEAAAAEGVNITSDDIAGERRRLLESLSDDPDTAIRLLENLRDRQGLGRTRFDGLLRRNAALRAMVGNRVEITEDDVRRMHAIVHGPKRQPRLIVVPSLDEARQAARRIEEGELFADVAVERSTDASAPRGGLLEPISRQDPSYPEALRTALWKLEPGEVSSPVLLDGQYALITLVREFPGDDVDIEEVRADLTRRARLSRERALMDQAARRLLGDVSVTIFDESLNDAWKRKRSR